jgi:hypothetical protein
MKILCHLARHRAVPSNIWNDGFYFSRCRSCGCEMIGKGGNWQPVPRGYRIVWRPRGEHVIDWTPASCAHAEPARLSDMIEVMH